MTNKHDAYKQNWSRIGSPESKQMYIKFIWPVSLWIHRRTEAARAAVCTEAARDVADVREGLSRPLAMHTGTGTQVPQYHSTSHYSLAHFMYREGCPSLADSRCKAITQLFRRGRRQHALARSPTDPQESGATGAQPGQPSTSATASSHVCNSDSK